MLLGDMVSDTELVPLLETDIEMVQLGGPQSPWPLQGQLHGQAVGALAPAGQKEPLGQGSGAEEPMGQ